MFGAPIGALNTWGIWGVFVVLCLMQAAFGYYFFGQDSFSYGNDDAFISYRYALNVVDHGTLSFNPSDAPPVEGFSNPLHVLLGIGLIHLFGPEGIYPAMAALGVAAVAGAILLTARHVAGDTDARTGALSGLVLALVPAFWIHATSGLETGFVFALQVVLWLSAAHIGTSR